MKQIHEHYNEWLPIIENSYAHQNLTNRQKIDKILKDCRVSLSKAKLINNLGLVNCLLRDIPILEMLTRTYFSENK